LSCPPLTFPDGGLVANPSLGFVLALAVMQFFKNWPLVNVEDDKVCTLDDEDFQNAAAVHSAISEEPISCRLHTVIQELILKLQVSVGAEYDFLGAWKDVEAILKSLGRPRNVYVRPFETNNSDDDIEEGEIYHRRRRTQNTKSRKRLLVDKVDKAKTHIVHRGL
jgi:hypothetical protein